MNGAWTSIPYPEWDSNPRSRSSACLRPSRLWDRCNVLLCKKIWHNFYEDSFTLKIMLVISKARYRRLLKIKVIWEMSRSSARLYTILSALISSDNCHFLYGTEEGGDVEGRSHKIHNISQVWKTDGLFVSSNHTIGSSISYWSLFVSCFPKLGNRDSRCVLYRTSSSSSQVISYRLSNLYEVTFCYAYSSRLDTRGCWE